MPQKTRVGNDRSQSTTDVARRRNRNEKPCKAGARSSVTLAAQNADRRAAVSEIELALSTRSGQSQSSIADVCGVTLSPHRLVLALIAESSDRPPRVIARRAGLGR